MAGETTYKFDLAVVAIVAAITTVVRYNGRKYFERTMPEWSKLKEDIKSRLAVEVAVIPSRIVLFYLTLPIMIGGFSPMEEWTSQDTARSLLSCAILTGAYIVDLTVTRNDKGATLHHMMGPALLLWIRTSFSSFSPSDALLCRLLIQFVFFGATISGATTTTLVFLYQFRKTWFRSSASNAYLYFTLLLPVLALTTVASTFYCSIYLNVWYPELLAYFGAWGYLPLGWVLLECGMQWKWLMWFYTFDEWYRATTADETDVPKEAKERIADIANGAWWLPRWRFAAIKALVLVWLVTVAALVWRKGDVHFWVGKAASLALEAWGGDGVNLRVANGSGIDAHVEL
ncbi:hypothetical protein B0T24DRAFT_597595 [Lasiosphaeria ovina]|uniref:Uncharacterized protein n=1 Tax=Lasiosphaeria ovina TaxID=92902 RepID=A0AAE0JWV7_9PEZI|nr:hypothetical protein B0T24DRAFT_597595 [Lasiosphaeria ovina]